MRTIFFTAVAITFGVISFSTSAKAAQSQEVQTFAKLYKELQYFKRDSKFHQVGFSQCCQYSKWMSRVETLDARHGGSVIREIRIPVRDLLALGLDYMRNKGRSTHFSQSIEKEINVALSPAPKLEKGKGVVLRTDGVCKTLDKFQEFYKALAESKYAEADRIITSHDCPIIYEKTVVTGPVKTETVKIANGSVLTFHQVTLKNGQNVWASDGLVKFE